MRLLHLVSLRSQEVSHCQTTTLGKAPVITFAYTLLYRGVICIIALCICWCPCACSNKRLACYAGIMAAGWTQPSTLKSWKSSKKNSLTLGCQAGPRTKGLLLPRSWALPLWLPAAIPVHKVGPQQDLDQGGIYMHLFKACHSQGCSCSRWQHASDLCHASSISEMCTDNRLSQFKQVFPKFSRWLFAHGQRNFGIHKPDIPSPDDMIALQIDITKFPAR